MNPLGKILGVQKVQKEGQQGLPGVWTSQQQREVDFE